MTLRDFSRYNWKPIDVALIVILFGITYAVAIWSGIMKQKGYSDKKRHKKSGVDFFLGGRTMPWYLIGVSLAASNIGTDILIATTGSVVQAGIGALAYEIGSGWSILCLGWVMGPTYLRAILKTIPSYMEERYNLWCRIVFVVFSVAIFILSKMGINVYSGALVFQTMIGRETPPAPGQSVTQVSNQTGQTKDLWIFTPVLIVITALYTFLGGLTSVMWADLVQFLIFLLSGLASVGYCLSFFNHNAGTLIRTLRGYGLDRLTHLILPSYNPDYPWPATTIGMLVHEYYYWSVDQEMAQRVISAKGLGDARMGCALGSMLKVACFFLSVIPGWTARVFYEQCRMGIGHFSWCGPAALCGDWDLTDAQQANRAYILLVIREYPTGFKGIMVAGFLAAIMSNLSGAINSLSTILTYDIYNRFFPPRDKSFKDHTQRRLVNAGRIIVLFCAGVTLVWQVGIQQIKINLFALTLAIQQHFGATIASTLLVGAAWRRSNSIGALSGMLFSGAFSIIHLAFFLRFNNTCYDMRSPDQTRYDFIDKNGHSARFYKFACLHYTVVCCLIWGISVALNVVVSLLTPKPNYRQLENYCIQWEDLIPRWVSLINPRFNKEDLDNGYIDRLRREALNAQQQVDREVEEERQKRQNGHAEHNGRNGRNGHNGHSRQQNSVSFQSNLENDLVNPLVDQEYLEKAQRGQQKKMQIAEYMGAGALFFTFFMFIWFR